MSDNLYEIKGLNKYYGKFQALKDVDISIGKGKIIGLLGRNGAGKSTLLRSMLGLLHYQGEISYQGVDIRQLKHHLFEDVAFIPDVNNIDDRLKVKELIEYVKGIHPRWNMEQYEILLAKSDLPLDKSIGKLSKGMKTKLYLLLTLSLDTDMLLLDEPTLGLDIAFRKEFLNTILGDYFSEEKSIIISTHQVEEVEQILQEIIFIDKGKIILHDNVEHLKDSYHLVSISGDRLEELTSRGARQISHTFGRYHGILPADVEIEGAEYNRPGLADLFLAFTGGSNE
ncbi:MAG: ABC transporter ATP-binding protein [Candidatus Cloacimonetes bacterium]|nr:ABC transporter ATP-binding protein [Candidatus Cloacimonadota bacterium]